MAKINVVSMANIRIGVIQPDLRFNREWPAKGYKIAIEDTILEELMFDPGFRYYIEHGMLFIEDMEFKKSQGLEPADATEPVNIIPLTEVKMKRMMTVMPMFDFKPEVDKLNYEQISDLVDYAVANRYTDIDKAKYLLKKCGKDIITTIQLGDADKEQSK